VGAIDLAGTWRTTAPVEDLWAVIVDLGTWPRWWPAIRDVELLGGAPGEPDAARFTFDTPRPLRPLVVTLDVVERRAPHHLAVRAVDGPMRGDGTLAVDAEDGGSAARFDLSLAVTSRLFRPVEVVLSGATRGRGSERLAKAGDDLAALAGGEPRTHDV
jgi:hypothetical protein